MKNIILILSIFVVSFGSCKIAEKSNSGSGGGSSGLSDVSVKMDATKLADLWNADYKKDEAKQKDFLSKATVSLKVSPSTTGNKKDNKCVGTIETDNKVVTETIKGDKFTIGCNFSVVMKVSYGSDVIFSSLDRFSVDVKAPAKGESVSKVSVTLCLADKTGKIFDKSKVGLCQKGTEESPGSSDTEFGQNYLPPVTQLLQNADLASKEFKVLLDTQVNPEQNDNNMYGMYSPELKSEMYPVLSDANSRIADDISLISKSFSKNSDEPTSPITEELISPLVDANQILNKYGSKLKPVEVVYESWDKLIKATDALIKGLEASVKK